jgi:glycopeptide antibiotics resistance protein
MEMIFNLVIFILFGLLLNVNFKQTSFRKKLATIFLFSLSAEIIQYILAIGRSDITDIITNTFGGWLGLELYDQASKYTSTEKLDKFIAIAGTFLFTLLLLFRFFIFRVKY